MPEQLISFITTCFRPEAVAIDQPTVTAGDFSQEYLSCTAKKTGPFPWRYSLQIKGLEIRDRKKVE
ncbi:MAG: hypothetical protein ACLPN1_10405 [Dissulfurispiraceae bacterium]